MSYSGILVRARPAGLPDLVARLAALPGVRVHQQDPARGRLVLTLAADGADGEVEGLRRIQRLPGVISADLVYHRLTDAPDARQGEV